MRVVSLGSGSSGNATLVESANGVRTLVDCGVAPARLFKHLAALGVRPDTLTAIVLTHEHGDHTQSAPVLRERYGIPVFAGPATLQASWLAPIISHAFDPAAAWAIGDLVFTPYAVPHDASETYGFAIDADGCRAALFTDLGSETGEIAPALARADLVVVEANHDREMLQNGAYPWFLKQRIGGRNGHLSNIQCAALLTRAFSDDRPRTVWLAHLSAHNNTPEVAVETVAGALALTGQTQTTVAALPRYARGPVWQAVRHQQLPLFDPYIYGI